MYADELSRLQYTKHIPKVNDIFSRDYTILAVTNNHILLSLLQPESTASGPTIQSTTSEKSLVHESWSEPSLHNGRNKFVLKIAHGESSMANEIKILKKLGGTGCRYVPEFVWTSEGSKELGIVPAGTPIDFTEPAATSRKIVQGLIEGLKFLHKQGIIHRDIKPSNLILTRTNHDTHVVITDYETAVVTDPTWEKDIYYGGFICWPRNNLKDKLQQYKPKPADDLFASILVILHMLFPHRFNAFDVANIGVSGRGQRTEETKQVLKLWDELERSSIWGQFVQIEMYG
ncbi:hypothetical protein AX17_004985 [Amanita inopinata Kibby_2008]|nr:hypothetical protein AX17_004985 [Amanita inopinata Kibby_2008]